MKRTREEPKVDPRLIPALEALAELLAAVFLCRETEQRHKQRQERPQRDGQ